MVETWICPDIASVPQRNFETNFAVLLLDYIYNNWPYTTLTGELSAINKPAAKEGQNNLIEFRPGLPDLQSFQVCTLQGRTKAQNPSGESPYLQTGNMQISLLTEVSVVTKAVIVGRDDRTGFLRLMDSAIMKICGQYKQTQQTPGSDMQGIKMLYYDQGDRQYAPNEQADKSDWSTIHQIWLWYILADIQ